MIDKNNIPQGYKNSTFGIIPEEWKVMVLGDLGLFSKGSGVSRSDTNSGEIPCVRYGELYTHHNIILKSFNSFVSREVANKAKLIEKGDVLFAATGETKQEIGKSVVYNDLREAYAGGDIIILSLNSSICDSNYMGYASNASYVIRQKAMKGQGDAIVHITTESIMNIKLPIPPLPEQKKIAEILCTWDDAIEKQSKLIEKLELRKRGLMQRLLTGKTRLPGFTEPWKKIKLGEIGKISSAGVDKKVNDNELPVRLLNFVDVFYRDFIYDSEITYWVTAKPIKAEQCSVQKGDIFFTPSSEKQTDIALSAVAMDDMSRVVYSYHIVRLRPHIEMDLHYRVYAFKTDEFYKQAERICDGSGQRYVISQDGFRNMVVHLPSLAEQKAIAEVLTSADKEITIQRKKLDSLRLQKRGLMQQLLAGKTRVRI